MCSKDSSKAVDYYVYLNESSYLFGEVEVEVEVESCAGESSTYQRKGMHLRLLVGGGESKVSEHT